MSIASNLKAQLVGQLIAALGNGVRLSTADAQKAAAAALAELQAGQSIIATVTGNAQNGKLPLLVNGEPLLANLQGAALPPGALRPGAQLQLKVETAGTTPKLAFQALETGTNNSPQVARSLTAVSPQISVAEARIVTLQNSAPLALTLPAASPLQQAIALAASDSATRQGSAAPLYANLAAMLAKPDNGLPQAIMRIATALLNNRLNGEAAVSANDVKQAIKGSGIFQEPQAIRPELQPLDAKALLLALREALRSNGALHTSKTPGNQEPPRRDGPVSAHKIAASSLKDETNTNTIISTLARESDQAVERVKLHQLASLPERLIAPEQPQNRQFNFEIPIALGQQTAMAGFRIEQEKKRNAKPGEPTDVWGIRFAIDADVIGPVHAHLRLAGPTISVSLWAEEPATHRFFVQAMPMLEAALAENALEIGELIAFPGKPAEARLTSAGHFLDKRS
jgi:Flagellar hook-length control protein FliK